MGVSAFARVLRHQRLARALTQEELAERAGLSLRAISDLERGIKLVPRMSTVRRLIQALEATEAETATLVAAACSSQRKSSPDGDDDAPADRMHAIEQARTPLLEVHYARRRDGASTAYGVVGRGPLLLVPPALLSHLEWWDTVPGATRWLQCLAEDRMLVLYDRHGCGLSDRNRTDFTAEDDMQDIEAVVAAVAPQRFDIFGDSWGSQPALAYTARHPERVRRLVLNGPIVRPRHETIGPETPGLYAERRLALSALRRADLEVYVRTIALMTFPSGVDPETLQSFIHIHRIAATVEMQEALDTVRFDLEPLLEQITTPTLIVHRRGDLACPFPIVEWAARRIPGARLAAFEGDAHMLWLGDWQPIARTIVSFLQQSDSGDAVGASSNTTAGVGPRSRSSGL